MRSILNLIGRDQNLFDKDIANNDKQLSETVKNSRFLVLGGAGSIGQAVTKEIFKRSPQKLHVIDINENNLVELVRDIRSEFGYISGEFQTFSIDIGSTEYDAFFKADGHYDFILNLSALKHVRSEKDPYTLMRMINVNILNTEKTLKQAIESGVKKYFCVSTDKAANPVNMMGASKRIMEMVIIKNSDSINVSTARFANVAFSDGSLLHGFNQRIEKKQPIVAPQDIKRYFITPKEAGELCLMSCIFGENREIFFPKPSSKLSLISFSEIAHRYLKEKNLEPIYCHNEDEARTIAKTLKDNKKWPCLFANSDTTGEKEFEEFYTDAEKINMEKFESIGTIDNELNIDNEQLKDFKNSIIKMQKELTWSKKEILELFTKIIPEFQHRETGKYLDNKM
ncbi:UDP-N-acetylglucosamine 4,6-dehydratase [Terasakiispira papahanaumokuakeensis]|uniref:UDP-N-acetylglucosamine 4,6-dehydratase n=1 Tax=Terasakiispira papahanaumokuakeensis TaxID=197479 RepID=A0A1E2VAW7_9GAMM|nr:UDP-N-acetylglucosamine 4,6-dehydratase [Terasakiispira papahanaumokuakeensis]ODC04159.1 UDP-N-acetylglucosamine 4,6-dehydratase [Terasakiispira papahanaumokuakeensis]